MNYFYVDNKTFIVGFSITTFDELKKTIPLNCPIYFYQEGDNLSEIVATKEPDGIGSGKKIDY